MAELKTLSAQISVGPQLQPADMKMLVAQGFSGVINNRPDDEEPGQPSSAEMEAAATAAGLAYMHVPIRGMPDDEAINAVAERLRADVSGIGRTAMFCRSGMRSVVTWAMALRLDGVDPDDLRRSATDAGYDLSRLPL